MRTRGKILTSALLCSTAIAALPGFALAQSVPSGATVRAGTATVAPPSGGNVTVNQSSQRAVINWQNFSVGAGNSVTFAQPNANSATLNRVTGATPSSVAGSITANGKVYLVNPNGVQITPTGRVDAKGGFVASTLGISNRDFMQGKDKFAGKGNSAAVTNQGSITTGQGGSVALIGGSVANEGTITAPLGKVALGAGEAATLDLNGDGFLQVTVPSDATDASGKPLVSNSGKIDAAGGTVELKAATVQNAMRDAVNMSGSISANTVSGHDGVVVLGTGDGNTVVTGSVDVSGADHGGRIDVTGRNVTLQGASLNAGGGTQGGLVRVGGAFQGGNPQDPASAQTEKYITRFGDVPVLANAQTTAIDANTHIDVSAAGGTGGTAIIWSEQQTTQLGAIDARGFQSGGAVEISSRSTVQSVNFSNILLGVDGTLLLDPKNINIVDDPGDGSVTFDTVVANGALGGDTGAAFADNASGTLILSGQAIMNILSAGTNVTLQASNDITWTTGGGVAAANPTQVGNLTLQAGRSVTISGPELGLLNGHLTIIANDTHADGVVDAYRDSGIANLDVQNVLLEGAFNFSLFTPPSYLTLKLLTGAGNTNHDAGYLKVNQPDFGEDVLDAEAGELQFANQEFLGRNVTLTGNIRALNNNPNPGVASTTSVDAYETLTWTNQYSAKLVTDNTAGTGFSLSDANGFYSGWLNYNKTDAVRLDAGSATAATDVYTAVYGNGYPTLAQLSAAHQQFYIDPQSAVQTLSDPATSILRGNAYQVVTPGQYQPVGNTTIAIMPNNGPVRNNLTGSYLLKQTLTGVTYNLTITPRPVTVTAVGDSYIYGSPSGHTDVTLSQDNGTTGIANGDVVIPVASVSGIAGGQTMIDVSGGTGGYGFAASLAAGSRTYTVTSLTGPGGGNYKIDTASSTATPQALTISPALLVPAVSAGSYIYGAPDDLVTLSGVINGDVVAPVATITGISGSQTLQADGSFYIFDAHTAAGSHSYTLTGLSGANAGNYQLDLTGTISAALAIAQKSVSFSNCCTVTSTYGTLATTSLALSGVLTGDSVTATVAAFDSHSAPVTLAANTPVGAYTISSTGLTGPQGGDYTLAAGSVFNLTINQLALTYTAPSGVVAYGTAFGGTVNLQGVVAGDTVSASLGIAPAGGGAATGYTNQANAGPYVTSALGLSGPSIANYTLATSGNILGSLTINPATLTFALSNQTVTYGDSVNLSNVLSGVLFSDDVSPTLSISAPGGTFSNTTPVGTYSASVTSLTGGKAANYVLASGGSSASITVNPRTLTYSTIGTTTVYGNTIIQPQGIVSLGNFANSFDSSDIHANLTITDSHGNAVTPASAGANFALLPFSQDAGTYTIGFSLASTDPANHPLSNYVLASSPTSSANFVIQQAPLFATLSTPGGAYNFTYGSAYLVGTDVLFTGFAPGQAGTGRVSVTDSHNNAVAVATNGSGYTATGQILAAGTDAGNYTVTVTGFDPYPGTNPANYFIANANSLALSMAPKTITYHGGSTSSTYGTLATIGALSVTGVLAGDDVQATVTVTPTTGVLLPISLAANTSVGSYTTAATGITGAKAFDYVLSGSGNSNGALTIAPKVITWSVADTSQTYNQVNTSQAVGAATLNGILSGDLVTGTVAVFGHNSSVFSQGASFVPDVNTNAGTYPMYVTGLTGAQAHNYVINPDLSLAHPGTLTINPYAVTLQISSVNLTYQDAYTPSLAQTPNFNGTLQVGYNVPAISDVGTYTVTGTAFVSPNYNITVLPGFVTVRPMVLTYSTAVVNQIQSNYINWVYGTRSDADLTSFVSDLQSFVSLTGPSGQNYTGTVPVTVAPYYFPGSTVLPLNQHTNVGTYPVLAATTSTNYVLQTGGIGYLTITPRPVTLNSATSVYGAQPSFSLDNVLPGDNLSVPTSFVSVTGTTGATYNLVNMWNADGSVRSSNIPSVDTYSISAALAGLQSNNYNLVAGKTPATLTVTPKPITVTSLTPVTTVYGTPPGIIDPVSGKTVYTADYDPTFATANGVTYSGLVYGGEAALLSPYMTPFGQPSVGIRTWTPLAGATSLAATANGKVYSCTTVGCANLNYVITGTVPSVTVTVTPKPITYTIASATTTYGTAVPLDVTFQGLLTQDLGNFSAALNISSGGVVQAVNGETASDGQGSYSGILGLAPAGSYVLTLQGIAGSAIGNYTLPVVDRNHAAPSATLTVNPKAITYFTYDATLYRQIGSIGGSLDDLGRYDVTGVLAADVKNVALSLAAAYSFPPGFSVPVSQITIAMLPGAYPIIVTGLSGSQAFNYVLASTGNHTGTLTVFDTSLLNNLSFTGQAVGNDLIKAAQTQRENLQKAVIAGDVTIGAGGTGADGGTSSIDPSITEVPEGGSSEEGGNSDTPTRITYGTSGNGEIENNPNEEALSKSQDWQVFPTDTTGFTGSAVVQVCDMVCESLGVTYNDTASVSYDHVAVREQVGIDASIAAQQDCGGGQCLEQFKEEAWAGEDASATAVANADGLALGFKGVAGAGVGMGGEVGYSDEYGAVDLYAGVTLDKWGVAGQFGVEMHDGYLQFDIGAEFDAGVGIDLDLKFSINVGVFTGYTTYVTTFDDPGAAEARENQGLRFVSAAQDLEESEQNFVKYVANGDYNNAPGYIEARVQEFESEEYAIQSNAKSAGFSLQANPDGTWSYDDLIPPATHQVATYHRGLVDDIKDWGDDIVGFL